MQVVDDLANKNVTGYMTKCVSKKMILLAGVLIDRIYNFLERIENRPLKHFMADDLQVTGMNECFSGIFLLLLECNDKI